MVRAGRPRISSRETLEEAASELFFEQGYDNTSVDDIAERAGVSRATFFNYFPTKADVLCVDIDRALQRLEQALVPGVSLIQALRQVAAETSSLDIPLIVSQAETMGLPDDIDGVLPMRVLRLRGLVARAVRQPVTQWAITGAIIEGSLSWARHPEASTLTEALDRALATLEEPLIGDVQRVVT